MDASEAEGTQIWMLIFRSDTITAMDGSLKEERSAMLFQSSGLELNQDIGSESTTWTSEDGPNNLAIQSKSQKVATRSKWVRSIKMWWVRT